MPLDPSDLATLSRLLDEALDLSPADFEVWLAALPAEHRHLLPRLRDMLASQSARGNTSFLSDGPKLAGQAHDDTVAHAGDLIGAYRLIREIGHGGMGTVWLAERADGTMKRKVALKLPRLAWGAGLTERMARERDIGALLEHPNIARLYDAGVDGQGRPYLALEYIDGIPIDRWCDAQGLDVRARLALFIQVIRAVAYAHGRLIVHRDLKPSNVLVTKDGQAHLLDFGIAKLLDDAAGNDQLTRAQDRLLTPHYASPEQIRGEGITVASDVYSLGVLLYELLTRSHPYKLTHDSIGAVEQAILVGEPEPASSKAADKSLAKRLHGEVDAILAKALKREPSERYANADALADDIQRHLDGERVLARPDSLSYRMGKVLRRHRTGFAAASLVVVATLGGLGVSLVQAQRANDAAERARVVKEFVVDVFKVNERGTQGNSELRQLPAELLLERGAKLIESKFPGQPQLQAELYGVVGGIFADMGSYELAADYATRQIEVLVAIGAGRSEQAKATILLAQALLSQGKIDDAEVRARAAVSLAAPDKQLRPIALVLLATTLDSLGRIDEAMIVLDRAEPEIADALGPTAARARAKTLRASVLDESNRFDEAMPVYLSALNDALAADGPNAKSTTDIRLAITHALLSHGWTERARPHRDAVLAALMASGSSGDVDAVLHASLIAEQMFLWKQVSFPEARSVIESGRATLDRRTSVTPKPVEAVVDFLLGATYLQWGDIATADRLLTNNQPKIRPGSARRQIYLYEPLSLVSLYAGRHQQADSLFHKLFRARVDNGEGHHPFAAFDYATAALNLAMQQRFDEAEHLIASAPPFAAVKGMKVAPLSYRNGIARSLARIKLERGDPSAALGLLPPDETDDPGTHTLFDGSVLKGEILCALGRRDEGLVVLDQALSRLQDGLYEYHPELARARASAGQCALDDGHATRAVELAALARASFVEQPGVSDYFKRPSEKLDGLLSAGTAKR